MVKVLLLFASLWTAVYTISYGYYEWKRPNRVGALGLFAMAVVVFGGALTYLFKN